jgi:hypothetical protein
MQEQGMRMREPSMGEPEPSMEMHRSMEMDKSSTGEPDQSMETHRDSMETTRQPISAIDTKQN